MISAALMVSGHAAVAQQVIGAGGLIQQIPPAPDSIRSGPDLRFQRPAGRPVLPESGPKAVVRSLHVTGVRLFSQAQLLAAAGFVPGAELSLNDLRNMAARIAGFYNRRGYFVAQAYVPAQDVSDGVVTIAVLEGRYDKIDLRNRTHLSDRVARGILAGLAPGDPVAIAPLERRLLLLSDLPGVRTRGTLAPGPDAGASELSVDLTSAPRVSGDVEADDAGDRYTGSYRGGGTINLNDPLGLGDQASVRALTSGAGLNYVRGSYQATAGDGTVGVAYTHFGYRLGKAFAKLDASGTEDIASVYASYPLVRSRNDNLYASADIDERWFRDDIGSEAIRADKRDLVGTIGLNGNHRDGLGGGGSDSFYVYGSLGSLDIETDAARLADAAGGDTRGGYTKLTFFVDRQQAVYGPLALYGAIRGQVAGKNLDISEKMELGGAENVRAYPEGEGYGDEGYVATVELRLLLPPLPPRVPGRVQLIGFFDDGQVRLEDHPYAVGSNTLTRRGAGVGVTWAQPNDFQLKLSYAVKLGTGPATSAPDRPGQVWVEFVKFF